jgi:hypothetical protein
MISPESYKSVGVIFTACFSNTHVNDITSCFCLSSKCRLSQKSSNQYPLRNLHVSHHSYTLIIAWRTLRYSTQLWICNTIRRCYTLCFMLWIFRSQNVLLWYEVRRLRWKSAFPFFRADFSLLEWDVFYTKPGVNHSFMKREQLMLEDLILQPYTEQ